MDKKTQDRIWAVLSKDEREAVRIGYKSLPYGSIEDLYFEQTFGLHNLTSGTEPDGDVFIIPVEQVRETYAYNEQILKYDPDHKGAQMLQSYLLQTFGDKCLPDEDISKMETTTESSVQGEPKFSKGERVKIADGMVKTFGNIATISHCEVDDGKILYWLDDDIGCYMESQLEPYAEPSNVSADETMNETMNETKDNMEEKELNLVELLKGCEGEVLYSTTFGNVILQEINADNRHPIVVKCKYNNNQVAFTKNGRYVICSTAKCTLFPSRALYEKYPLDAYAAWMEWKSERTPKRWYPELGEKFWHLNLSMNPSSITSALPKSKWEGELNCFKTEEECQQAAEAVRECLMKFHEKNTEQ